MSKSKEKLEGMLLSDEVPVHSRLTAPPEKDMIYSAIALWKLEKPIVRKAPSGAFRYLC